jgi:hypothetical protein
LKKVAIWSVSESRREAGLFPLAPHLRREDIPGQMSTSWRESAPTAQWREFPANLSPRPAVSLSNGGGIFFSCQRALRAAPFGLSLRVEDRAGPFRAPRSSRDAPRALARTRARSGTYVSE